MKSWLKQGVAAGSRRPWRCRRRRQWRKSQNKLQRAAAEAEKEEVTEEVM